MRKSSIYDLLDMLCFRREAHSPHTTLAAAIPDGPVRVLDICAGTAATVWLSRGAIPKLRYAGVDAVQELVQQSGG